MTEAELLQAVTEALAAASDPEGFYTTKEWGAMFQLSVPATRSRIQHLMAQGKMEHGKVVRQGMNGVASPTHAYRFMP